MRVSDITWDEYDANVSHSLIVLPVGALEGHGTHLPLATDTKIAQFLADEMDKFFNTLQLPPLTYGYKTNPLRTGGDFPGATSISATTLSDQVLQILSSSASHGATRFLLLHGHIANVPIVFDAVERFISSHAGVRVLMGSWWDFSNESTRNNLADQTGTGRSVDHHAAMVETSLLMHIDATLVHTNRLVEEKPGRRVRYTILPLPDDVKTNTGTVYDARNADASIGKLVLTEVTENLATAVKTEFDDLKMRSVGHDD